MRSIKGLEQVTVVRPGYGVEVSPVVSCRVSTTSDSIALTLLHPFRSTAV